MGRSSYPGQFDSDVELPRVDDDITEIGGEAINSLRDAIFSIENAIGLNPQGNMSDLVTRINKVIDQNGIIKTTALAEKGLVTLPISDAHIADRAGIKESKLDLDYPTATLYAKYTSNLTDIGAIRTGFNAFASRTIQHFAGSADRHDGYQIGLQNPIRGSDDLETALNILNNAFSYHEVCIGAHDASNISVNNEFEYFSASNVQDALVELEQIGTGRVEKHQDLLHTNAIGLNAGGEQGEQGNLAITTLASTIFRTETSKATNILQVMRPNVARVTSKNINLRALKSGDAFKLRIEAGGIGRSYLDIDLTAIIPVESIDDVVDAINQTAQGCLYHYPISAYNTGGRLTIAHNIPGEDFTIQIRDDVEFSAASALGFGDATSTVFRWSEDNHSAYVGGNRVKDLKSYIKVHYNHKNRPLSVISPGVGDLSDYGISVGNEGRILCNITNHSTNPEDNGTHYIVAFPNNQSFSLSADIQHGEFDIEIPADAVNFQNTANGNLYDIFVEYDRDGYGIVKKLHRLSYGTISGINLRAVSQNFPTENVEWQVTDSNSVQLFENGFGGVPSNIPAGYTGPIKVFAPDNVNSAIFEVTGAPSNLRRSLDIVPFAGSDDKLYVSSVHHGGNYGLYKLQFVTDKRQIGGSIENDSQDILAPTIIEDSLNELRNNGIIRGLDVISTTPNSIMVRGGKALVSGRIVNIETQDVLINEFGAAKRLLLLDKFGNILVKSEYDAGFALDDLISDDAYGDNRDVAIIAEFETNGSAIDGYVHDRRLIVSGIDKKLLDVTASLEQKITQVQNTVQGSMWGFTVVNASPIDGYLGILEVAHNEGFTYIPSKVGWWDQSELSARGFLAGQSYITTRRFEFSHPSTTATSIFRAPGLTHINVFVEVKYTGNRGGPFGVGSTVHLEVGIAVETGMSNIIVSEEYARVRTFSLGVLPSNIVTERYVASIPTSQLYLPDNVMFDVVPRVRVINSNYVNGGTGDDPEPVMVFDHIRVVMSSYSIAGNINGQDGSSMPLAAKVGEVL